MRITSQIKQLIRLALKEDIGTGDITTSFLVKPNNKAKAIILAKSKGILCGLPVCQEVFRVVDRGLKFRIWHQDGDLVKPKDGIVEIEGKTCSILTAERTALNFLQHLSGIATLTHEFVQRAKGTSAGIYDTRKTTPGWRGLEKYAVKAGGGKNHRMGLYDQILIKDNHLRVVGSIKKAVIQAKAKNKKKLLVEVETKNLQEVKEALSAGADWVMLDNYSLPQIRKAVKLIRQFSKTHRKKITIEVSGNIGLKNVGQIAQAKPDLISVGQLTHSAPALDFSLKIIKSR